MPPQDLVTKDFLREVLKDEKKLLKMEQVKHIKVPKYQELSVKSLYQQTMEDENLRQYFPSMDGKKKTIDREYFFNILNSIYPDFVRGLIEHAQNIRNAPDQNEEKKEYILISDDWYNKLMLHPFISRKPGKTVQLLKESTKVLKGRKQKKINELGFTLKRFKGEENIQNRVTSSTFQQNQQMHGIFEEFDQSEDQSPQRKQLFNI